MVTALLSTQNKVGPGSPVEILAETTPFPLAYEIVCRKRNVERFIAETVRRAGIGKYNQIAHYLAANLRCLKEGEWAQALRECNRLTTLVEADTERDVATYLADTFTGLGPKQSRNLLQKLGLTRYEIPIHSRLSKWLNPCISPVTLTSTRLANSTFHVFVLDGVRDLCQKAGTFPCIFDAAVFTAMERQ